jgi:hypothetical protein
MQGENPAKRSRFALMTVVLLVGAVVTMLLATPASALHSKNPSRPGQIGSEGDKYLGFDPMETSVPYVAWRGEEVRLVKCFDSYYFEPRQNGDPSEGGLTDEELSILALEANETGEWQIMDWSGDDHVWPKFFDDNDQQTQVFWPSRGDQKYRGCFAIDITSHKPGIAVVKLKVDDEGDRYADGVGEGIKGEGDPVATHQFVVIWMAFEDVRLRDLDGDNPLGPVTVNPGDDNQLGVVVQGRIPLNDEFKNELGLPAAIRDRGALVFPEDYPALARTPLAHISWPLQKANNGIEGDDNLRNRTCNDSPDDGSLEYPDAYACALDRDDEDYIPEPRHSPGDFWDIHDSTGPYNTDVYDSATVNDKPDIADICPGPAYAANGSLLDDHDDCHVDQLVRLGSGDRDCEDDPGNARLNGGPNDTVDNCDRGAFDAFSRVFHDVAGEDNGDNDPVFGPYSPTRPDETVLSDSTLNAHDAPMPSALVVVSIAPNQGGDDIGGVGSLVADKKKEKEYNRLQAGDEVCEEDKLKQHCVTGPFNAAYIPPSPTMENGAATVVDDEEYLYDDSDTASGIHGAIANNFNGYLPVSYQRNRGLYHYWDLVDTLRVAIPTETKCVAPPTRPQEQPRNRLTPEGPQEIALYTDEHGEARLHFNAGTGFFFDNFITNPTQRSCRPEGLIGTADITVNARYPFQPTTSAGAVSNTLRKNVESLFEKGILCKPKPGEEQDKVLCVAFGRDIDGSPLIGERVCVTVGTGASSVRTFIESHATDREGDWTVCARLHENEDEMEDLGTDLFPTIDDSYAIETFLIIGRGSIRVIADFRDEFLEFPADVTIPPAPGTTGASVGTPLPLNQQLTPVVPRPVTGPGGVALVPTVGPPSNPTVNAPVNKQVLKPAVLRAKASLAFVRIVKPLKLGGVRYVVLRVKSTQKNSRVQIKLIGKRGKVLGTMLRKVKTNRTFRVPNLRLPKAAVTVRAKVIS